MLEVRNLSVVIDPGSRPVVSDLSLALADGKCLALVGASGCGKSMTSLAIMGLLPAGARIASGEIVLDGVNIAGLSESQFSQIRGKSLAMVFQEPSTALNPVLTVGEQILEAMAVHGMRGEAARARLNELLNEVGLERSKASSFPHELSGGQKQRIMIAMALAMRAKVLIADEPTTALDVSVQKQVLEVLSEVKRLEGISILFITHDLAVARHFADEICLMHAGQVVEAAPARIFFAHPAHPNALALIAAVNASDPPGISSVPPDHSHCAYRSSCPLATGSCDSTAIPLREVTPGHFVRCVKDAGEIPASRPAFRQRGPAAPVLCVEGLRVTYRKGGLLRKTKAFEAVKDVSFTLAKGRTLAVVGESGSGKTTLFKGLLGLLDGKAAVSGRFSLQGGKPFEVADFARCNRGFAQMVFQDPYASLDPMMTVEEAIQEGMRSILGVADAAVLRKRTAELLEMTGLAAEVASRYPHAFSGGQRQRIAIARALAVSPQVLVCDEPTSALDVLVQSQILSLLESIQKKTGLTVVLITHNFAVVRRLADDVLVMRQGRLVESGPAAQVLEHPKSDYTRALLEAVPEL